MLARLIIPGIVWHCATTVMYFSTYTVLPCLPGTCDVWLWLTWCPCVWSTVEVWFTVSSCGRGVVVIVVGGVCGGGVDACPLRR